MSLRIGLTWCLAWGAAKQAQVNLEVLQKMRQTMLSGESAPDEVLSYVQQANRLSCFSYPATAEALKAAAAEDPDLWKAKVGLVYGGATKIKQYVFESADLQEIRGASALLDRINLIDLPAFFEGETSDRFDQCQEAASYCRQVRNEWLYRDRNDDNRDRNFPELRNALIPELVIYSTGGNILALCPAALVDTLADAIEKRYTTETLTANSCAVGEVFRAPEIYLGLLPRYEDNKVWCNTLQAEAEHNPVVQAYFDLNKPPTNVDAEAIKKTFDNHKAFSELTAKLANQFNQRRSGFDLSGRTSRRYPPMFETHPYVMRDDSDRRSAVAEIPADVLPDNPKLSEPTARKRRVGQITKRERTSEEWFKGFESEEGWNLTFNIDGDKKAGFQSWVSKFEEFLIDPEKGHLVEDYDEHHQIFDQNWQIIEPYKREARSLHEIGAASDGFVAYIYADGNNMGQHIRNNIKTPEDYREFSADIFTATEQSVYWALAHHVHPYRYTPDAKSSRENKNPVWIHPFEIITIGDDDVLLVVPANTALEVAHAIGAKFESILVDTGRYQLRADDVKDAKDPKCSHRYRSSDAPDSECSLSISSGVLITAVNTPIYYADKLVSQLLKSAKKKAKDLKNKYGYHSGTVDFLTLKAVTMISSNIDSFREEGLTVRPDGRSQGQSRSPEPKREQVLKLYAAPFTLHELKGLVETVRAIKDTKFPRSQLYQIRSLLERGKRTAILNYRYFRVRLGKKEQMLLENMFEAAWCKAETNSGNLAPWLTADTSQANKTVYETIWRELVELYPFIQELETDNSDGQAPSSQPATAREDAS